MPTWVIPVHAISFRCVSASGFHANTHKSRVFAQGSFVLSPTRERKQQIYNFLSMVMIHSQTMRGFVNRDLYFYPLTHSELSVNTHICSDSSERSNGAEEVCRRSVCRKSVCNEERPNLGGQKKNRIFPTKYTPCLLPITTPALLPYFLKALRTLKSSSARDNLVHLTFFFF